MLKKALNKYNNLSIPTKAALVYLVVMVIQKSMAFLTSPIFARLLTVSEYGEVAVYFSWQEVIGIVALFCLQGGVFNNGMVDYPEQRDSYSFSMLILSNILTVATFILLVPINRALHNFLELDNLLLTIMFAYFLLQPALGFWTTRQRYEYKYKASSIINLISFLIPPAVSIGFIYCFNWNPVHERIVGYVIPLLMVYIPFYVYLGIRAKWHPNIKFWGYALKFNVFLIPHYFSMYLLNSSDRVMIKKILGSTEAGYYSMAYSISALISAITTAIHSALVPLVYENCKSGNYKKIRQSTNSVVLVIFSISIMVTLIAPEVLLLLSSREYYNAIYVIPPIIAGVFFQSLYSVYASVVYYYKKPAYVMIGSITSAVVNVILNLMFIPMYGYVAAGYTTMISYILQAVIDLWAVKKVANSEIYDKKFLIVISMLALLIAIGSPIIYDYVLLRYCLLALIVLVALIKRRWIMQLVKELKSKGE